jgi:large subunit ribosomal protein L17
MRHRNAGVKLNRTTSHRQAMFRNMVTSLFKYDRIRTTDVKAKELRRWADRIITLAKRGDLHARRQVMAIVREKDVVHKLFEDAAARFGNINGGYTRIVKIGTRPGDSAPISMIELVAIAPKPKKEKKKTKAAAATGDKDKKAKAGKATDAAPKAKKKAEPASEEAAPAVKKAKKAKAEAPEAEAKTAEPAAQEAETKEAQAAPAAEPAPAEETKPEGDSTDKKAE